MERRLVTITAPHYTASIIIAHGVCTETGPILRGGLGKTWHAGRPGIEGNIVIERREWLTADERRLLESCYACKCKQCGLRKAAIMKAIRIIDGLPAPLSEAALASARMIPAEHSCGPGCLRCWAVSTGQLVAADEARREAWVNGSWDNVEGPSCGRWCHRKAS